MLLLSVLNQFVFTNGVRRKNKEPPKMVTRPARAKNPAKQSRGLSFDPDTQTKLIVSEQSQIPVKKQMTRHTTLKRPHQTLRAIQASRQTA